MPAFPTVNLQIVDAKLPTQGTGGDRPFPFRPGMLLLCIIGLFCLSLEVEVIEQVDSMSLYLRYDEIALVVGVALLLLCFVSIVFWLCVYFVATIVGAWTKRNQSKIWYVGLSVPFAYLVLDAFGACKLWLLPRWHPGLIAWFLVPAGFIFVSGLIVHRVDSAKIEEFCRTRLGPVGRLHVIIAVVAAGVLLTHHVHLFRDYVRPGNAVAVSSSPDIYLITFDALRAEDMSVYGYDRPTTPNLERFAQRSFVFDYFFANSNFTKVSTTSIDTGKLPWSHRVFQQGGFLRSENQGENLAAMLHERGYYTAMIASNPAATPWERRTDKSYDAVESPLPPSLIGLWLRYTNLAGVDSQFCLISSLFERAARAISYVDAYVILRGRYPSPPEETLDRTRELLEHGEMTQPRFIWTHISPPHDPYIPPPPFLKHFLPTNEWTRYDQYQRITHVKLPNGMSSTALRDRYDEMVLYGDDAVGKFLDWLDRTGRLDEAVVIITADHGDSFEHGWFKHEGPYLYNGLVRIPLLIHLPRQQKSIRVYQQAEQADVLPTIVDLVGGKVPSWTDGTSLKPALEGETLPQRFIFSMNLEKAKTSDPISQGTIAIIDDNFKFVKYLPHGDEALYRYRSDEFEEHNIVASEPETSRRLRDALLSKLQAVNREQDHKP